MANAETLWGDLVAIRAGADGIALVSAICAAADELRQAVSSGRCED